MGGRLWRARSGGERELVDDCVVLLRGDDIGIDEEFKFLKLHISRALTSGVGVYLQS